MVRSLLALFMLLTALCTAQASITRRVNLAKGPAVSVAFMNMRGMIRIRIRWRIR